MGDMPLELEQVLEETGWFARREVKNRAKWEAKGEAKGEEMGRRKEGIEIARNALTKGLSIEMIHDITGLPAEVIATL